MATSDPKMDEITTASQELAAQQSQDLEMEDSDQDSSSEFSTTEDSAVDSPIAERIALARVATNAGSQEKSKETSGTQKITQEPTKEELGAFVVQLDLSHWEHELQVLSAMSTNRQLKVTANGTLNGKRIIKPQDSSTQLWLQSCTSLSGKPVKFTQLIKKSTMTAVLQNVHQFISMEATRKSRTTISKPTPPLVTSGEFPTIPTSDNRKKILTESLLKTGKSFAAISHVPRSVALAARSSMRKTTNMTAFESACLNQGSNSEQHAVNQDNKIISEQSLKQGSNNKPTEQQSLKQDNRKRSADQSLKSKEQIVREVVPTTNHSQSTADIYCRYFRQNIYCIDDTNGTAPSSVDSRKSRCKENSAQNDYINQRANRRFIGIANTVINTINTMDDCNPLAAISSFGASGPTRQSYGIAITVILLCVNYQLVIFVVEPYYKLNRETLARVCAIVMVILAAILIVYIYCSFARFIMTSCEYPYLECYVTILSTPEELSIPLDSLACNSCTEHSTYYMKCVAKQIDSLSNSNGTIDESTNSDAPDQNNSSTNNPEDYAFDGNGLNITNSSADTTQTMQHLSLDSIKIVHWNCQGANGKLDVLKDAIQKDGIHIILLQDTRLLRRNDDLPKLRLHGYSTYDVPTSATSHGMMILVHKDIPSDFAPEVKFGTQTESLSIRIWVRGVSYLIHNII